MSALTASSGLTASDIAAWIAIAGFAVAVIGGIVTYFIRRRGTTGTVATSDAAVLWEQAQKMRAELEAQRDKAIEQRDRLIESQSAQVFPALQLVIQSLKQITESLARLEGRRRGDADGTARSPSAGGDHAG